MKRKLFLWLGNGTLIVGALLGGYALVKIWIVRAAGACPVDANRPILYAGIALCLASFVFTLLEKRAKKEETLGMTSGEAGDE